MALDAKELQQIAAMLGDALAPKIREAVAANVSVRLEAFAQTFREEVKGAVDAVQAATSKMVEQATATFRDDVLKMDTAVSAVSVSTLSACKQLVDAAIADTAKTTTELLSGLSTLDGKVESSFKTFNEVRKEFGVQVSEVRAAIPVVPEPLAPLPFVVDGELSPAMREAMGLAAKQVLSPMIEAALNPINEAVNGVKVGADEAISKLSKSMATVVETIEGSIDEAREAATEQAETLRSELKKEVDTVATNAGAAMGSIDVQISKIKESIANSEEAVTSKLQAVGVAIEATKAFVNDSVSGVWVDTKALVELSESTVTKTAKEIGEAVDVRLTALDATLADTKRDAVELIQTSVAASESKVTDAAMKAMETRVEGAEQHLLGVMATHSTKSAEHANALVATVRKELVEEVGTVVQLIQDATKTVDDKLASQSSLVEEKFVAQAKAADDMDRKTREDAVESLGNFSKAIVQSVNELTTKTGEIAKQVGEVNIELAAQAKIADHAVSSAREALSKDIAVARGVTDAVAQRVETTAVALEAVRHVATGLNEVLDAQAKATDVAVDNVRAIVAGNHKQVMDEIAHAQQAGNENRDALTNLKTQVASNSDLYVETNAALNDRFNQLRADVSTDITKVADSVVEVRNASITLEVAAGFEARVTTTENSLGEVRHYIESFRKEVTDTTEAVDHRFEVFAHGAATDRAAGQSLDARVKDLAASIPPTIEARVERAQQVFSDEINRIEAEAGLLNTRIGEVGETAKAALDTAASIGQAIVKKDEEVQANFQQIRASNETTIQDVIGLKNKAVNTETLVGQTREELNAARLDVKTFTGRVADVGAAVDKVSDAVGETGARLDQVQSSVDYARTQGEAHQRSMHAAVQRTLEVEKAVLGLNTNIEALQAASVEREAENAAAFEVTGAKIAEAASQFDKGLSTLDKRVDAVTVQQREVTNEAIAVVQRQVVEAQSAFDVFKKEVNGEMAQWLNQARALDEETYKRLTQHVDSEFEPQLDAWEEKLADSVGTVNAGIAALDETVAKRFGEAYAFIEEASKNLTTVAYQVGKDSTAESAAAIAKAHDSIAAVLTSLNDFKSSMAKSLTDVHSEATTAKETIADINDRTSHGIHELRTGVTADLNGLKAAIDGVQSNLVASREAVFVEAKQAIEAAQATSSEAVQREVDRLDSAVAERGVQVAGLKDEWHTRFAELSAGHQFLSDSLPKLVENEVAKAESTLLDAAGVVATQHATDVIGKAMPVITEDARVAAVGAVPAAVNAQVEGLPESLREALLPLAAAEATRVADTAIKAAGEAASALGEATLATAKAEAAAVARVTAEAVAEGLREPMLKALDPADRIAVAIAAALPAEVRSVVADHLSVVEPKLFVQLAAKVQAEVDRIPRPRDGRDGTDGTDGKNGRVAPPVPYEVGKRYESGAWVAHDHGVWVAARNTNTEPTADSSDWDCAVPGIKAVESTLQSDGRSVDIHFELTNGAFFKSALKLPVPINRGIYSADGVYEAHDVATHDGSTWEAQKAGKLARPGTSSDWKLITKRGADGKDLKQPKASPLRYAASKTWVAGTLYEAGEVVEHAGVNWAAMKSNHERPPYVTLTSNDVWLKMGS